MLPTCVALVVSLCTAAPMQLSAAAGNQLMSQQRQSMEDFARSSLGTMQWIKRKKQLKVTICKIPSDCQASATQPRCTARNEFGASATKAHMYLSKENITWEKFTSTMPVGHLKAVHCTPTHTTLIVAAAQLVSCCAQTPDMMDDELQFHAHTNSSFACSSFAGMCLVQMHRILPCS